MELRSLKAVCCAAAAISAAILAGACSPYTEFGGRHIGPGMHGFLGMGWLGLFFWAFLLALVVALIRWFWRTSGAIPRQKKQEDRALEILRERYARGEINKEEFESMKNDLMP